MQGVRNSCTCVRANIKNRQYNIIALEVRWQTSITGFIVRCVDNVAVRTYRHDHERKSKNLHECSFLLPLL